MSLGQSISTVIVDRVFDLLTLITLSVIGAFTILLKFNRIDIAQYVFITVIIGIAALFFVLRKSSVRRIARPIFNIFVPEIHKEKLKIGFEDFYDSIKFLKNKKKTLIIVFIISALAWLIGYIQSYLLLLALGYNVDYIYLVSLLPIEVLVSLIPITISGFGTREASLIALLGLFNVPAEVAVSLGLLGFFLVLGLSLVGLFIWFKKPLDIKL